MSSINKMEETLDLFKKSKDERTYIAKQDVLLNHD